MTAPTHEVEVKPRIRLSWAAEAVQGGSPPQLVQGLLPAGCLGVIYGEANSGKSTLSLDLGLAIATGNSWRGHRVQRGVVLHVAGEGLYGLCMRLRAAIREGRGSPGMPYAIVEGGVDLTNLGDLADLSARTQILFFTHQRRYIEIAEGLDRSTEVFIRELE